MWYGKTWDFPARSDEERFDVTLHIIQKTCIWPWSVHWPVAGARSSENSFINLMSEEGKTKSPLNDTVEFLNSSLSVIIWSSPEDRHWWNIPSFPVSVTPTAVQCHRQWTAFVFPSFTLLYAIVSQTLSGRSRSGNVKVLIESFCLINYLTIN